jgi:hypothetical protein
LQRDFEPENEHEALLRVSSKLTIFIIHTTLGS